MSEPEVPDPGFDSSPEPANNSTIKKEEMFTNVYKQTLGSNNNTNRDSSTLNIQNNNNIQNIDDAALLSFIKNRISSEGKYGIISLRVSLRAKTVWDALDVESKRMLRNVFENILLQYTIQYQKQQIINVNVNINVNKVENKVNESSSIQDALNEIAEMVSRLYSLRNTLPPLQRQVIEKLYEKVESLILGDNSTNSLRDTRR